MNNTIQQINPTPRILSLKEKTFSAKRYVSIEQAKIITDVYRENENEPVERKRSLSLSGSLSEISITIDPEELIVGNRTKDVRAGVVFPEAGISWLSKEMETLPTRPQDTFHLREGDVDVFKKEIAPYWKGKTLEDSIYTDLGEALLSVGKVVKINQKDHAQGHICPNVAKWLKLGPKGLLKLAEEKKKTASKEKELFYESLCRTLETTLFFIKRYAILAEEMKELEEDVTLRNNLEDISLICSNLSEKPAANFREALQSLWFLFVVLQMESNASSFSPGRMDQYLLPYLEKDLKTGKIDLPYALEMVDALFIKFNEIVYLRNEHSAAFFAGFPIGFNVTIGGQNSMGEDSTNLLSYLFLKAQDHMGLPQPNLSARLNRKSPNEFVLECSRVIGLGSGMPQIANDESIVPSLENVGIDSIDAKDYALVGCVELSTQGNYLGWSDAAMFNLVKVLELTLNDGVCMISGEQLGINNGGLKQFTSYEELEEAFSKQIDYFVEKMIEACEVVEKAHQRLLPSAFLSSVVDNCIEAGMDVTAGGAKYNLSGIQAIQVANVADSMAVLKQMIFTKKVAEKNDFLAALLNDFEGNEALRQRCLHRVPKYGNDIEWVDLIGKKWVEYFNGRITQHQNIRGGKYHLGLYTVSAHVPMGKNVGATPDGRRSQTPLADGGMSPMYGKDTTGPTAVLKSVSRIPSKISSNGTLLNMKFLPSFFKSENDLKKFGQFLKTFVQLPIHHIQFNVVNGEELLKAKENPELYTGLTIRVAGYTAYFTELSEDLQNEIIERTTHG